MLIIGIDSVVTTGDCHKAVNEHCARNHTPAPTSVKRDNRMTVLVFSSSEDASSFYHGCSGVLSILASSFQLRLAKDKHKRYKLVGSSKAWVRSSWDTKGSLLDFLGNFGVATAVYTRAGELGFVVKFRDPGSAKLLCNLRGYKRKMTDAGGPAPFTALSSPPDLEDWTCLDLEVPSMHATNRFVTMAGENLEDFDTSEVQDWLGRYFTAHADRTLITPGTDGTLDIEFHSQEATDAFVHGFFSARKFVCFWDRAEITFTALVTTSTPQAHAVKVESFPPSWNIHQFAAWFSPCASSVGKGTWTHPAHSTTGWLEQSTPFILHQNVSYKDIPFVRTTVPSMFLLNETSALGLFWEKNAGCLLAPTLEEVGAIPTVQLLSGNSFYPFGASKVRTGMTLNLRAAKAQPFYCRMTELRDYLIATGDTLWQLHQTFGGFLDAGSSSPLMECLRPSNRLQSCIRIGNAASLAWAEGRLLYARATGSCGLPRLKEHITAIWGGDGVSCQVIALLSGGLLLEAAGPGDTLVLPSYGHLAALAGCFLRIFQDDQDSDLEELAGTCVLLLCSSDSELLSSSAMVFQEAGWCLNLAVTKDMVTRSKPVSAAGMPETQEFAEVDASAADRLNDLTLALALSRSTFRPQQMTRIEIVGHQEVMGHYGSPLPRRVLLGGYLDGCFSSANGGVGQRPGSTCSPFFSTYR